MPYSSLTIGNKGSGSQPPPLGLYLVVLVQFTYPTYLYEKLVEGISLIILIGSLFDKFENNNFPLVFLLTLTKIWEFSHSPAIPSMLIILDDTFERLEHVSFNKTFYDPGIMQYSRRLFSLTKSRFLILFQ